MGLATPHPQHPLNWTPPKCSCKDQAGIPQAVLQGVQAIRSSADWHQLQAAFATSTAQLRAAAAAQGSRGQQQLPQHHQRSSGGGSPWGFALRQPGSQRPPALNPMITSSSSPQPILQPQFQSPSPPSQHNSPAVPVQQAKGQEHSWQLEGAQQLVVLGLGSISALLPSSSSSSSSSGQAAAPSRLGYRLMQLALAVALQQHLLTGATKQPLAYDPGFEPRDVDLLEGLGFEVAGCEPHHTVSCRTLFYMPCCPRQLYSDVLGANWQQLHQLAILGTSMRSLSDTQSLFSALVQESEADADTPPGRRMSAAGSSTAVDRADVSSLLAAEMMQQQQQQRVPLQQQQQVCGVDVVSRAYSEGRVLEVVCPDFSAHAVGVSLHLFRPEQKHHAGS